ncbi:MAG: fimbrillin family protein [Phocaeicola sp.]
MYKRILPFSLLLLAASCSQSHQQEPIDQALEIQFSPTKEWDFSTRGSIQTQSTLKSMALYGYYSPVAQLGETTTQYAYLFEREKLTLNSQGNWTYELPRYWVTKGYHHFFAFAPYEDLQTIEQTVGSYPSLHHTVPLRVKEQKDILWSLGETINRVYDKNSDNNVHFKMNHALTRLSFSAATTASYSGETVCIEKLILHNLYYQAKSEISFAGQTITAASWVVDVTQTASVVAQIEQSSDTGELVSNRYLTPTQQPLLVDNEYFFVMPQSFANRTSDAPQLEIHFRGEKDQVLRIVNTPLVAPATNSWDSGQAIEYKLLYNGGGDTPFNLLGVVVPWESQEVDVNLPATYLNVTTSSVTLSKGKAYTLYFSTDGDSPSHQVAPQVATTFAFDAATKVGTVVFPATADAGVYQLTVTSDGLSRIVTITVI